MSGGIGADETMVFAPSSVQLNRVAGISCFALGRFTTPESGDIRTGRGVWAATSKRDAIMNDSKTQCVCYISPLYKKS